jgi:hypothetical protein
MEGRREGGREGGREIEIEIEIERERELVPIPRDAKIAFSLSIHFYPSTTKLPQIEKLGTNRACW